MGWQDAIIDLKPWIIGGSDVDAMNSSNWCFCCPLVLSTWNHARWCNSLRKS